MTIKAFIAGMAGHSLSTEEVAFFGREQPWGFILFARNVADPRQLAELTDHLRRITGRPDTPILIDQEGGRVQRLRAPHWPSYPTGRALGNIYRQDRTRGLRAAWLQSRLMALDLVRVGINVDCLPVLDVPIEGAHDVIGDRAYSTLPGEVAEIARAACNGLLEGGVLPIIKHIPGHGRAAADSHKELPAVDASARMLSETDFVPFRRLADMPMAMTAHVVYRSLDPDQPATTSPFMIREIIRGWIGFGGLVMSDDLSMQALSGDFATRTQSCFAAGCDVVLHCNGVMAEMVQVAAATPKLDGEAAGRARLALDRIQPAGRIDEPALRDEFAGLMEMAIA